MATNVLDDGTQWTALEDGEAGTRQRCRFQKWALALIGLLGLAATAVYFIGSPGPAPVPAPDSVSIVEHEPLPKQDRRATEPVMLPSQISHVTTVSAFNSLLASTILIDSKATYDAFSLDQFESLFGDFLLTIGSQAPDISGVVPNPQNGYDSQQEHERRLEIFKKNIFTVIHQTAEEYKHNPDVNRARFGITTHADWTEDEFLETRLNLKATDLSAEKVEALSRKSAFEKSLAIFGNSSKVPKPVDLNGDVSVGTNCKIETGGTCSMLPCNAERGSVCYERQCICTNSACADDQGTCVWPGNCKVATGGSCHVFNCDGWRNAQCVKGACVCAQGMCAKNGKCGPNPSNSFQEHPNRIQCSKHFITPVRNQGSCGDCWAFATAQQLRFMTFAKYGKDPGVMSVQYMVDCMPEVSQDSCSDGVKGCCGGLPMRADRWLQRSGGAPTQAQYGPLLSDKNPMTRYPCKQGVQKTVLPGDVATYHTETAMAEAICTKGPLAIAIAANTALMHYAGGVMTARAVPADRINHAVLLTGVDRTFDNGQPVHIILNSWGDTWGVPTSRPYAHKQGEANGHVLFKFDQNVGNIKALATGPEDVQLL